MSGLQKVTTLTSLAELRVLLNERQNQKPPPVPTAGVTNAIPQPVVVYGQIKPEPQRPTAKTNGVELEPGLSAGGSLRPSTKKWRPKLDDLIAERTVLLREKDENLDLMANCKQQIANAVARHHTDGGHAEPRWYAAVNTKARFAGKRDQQIASRLSEIRREIHEIRMLERTEFKENYGATPKDGAFQMLLEAMRLIQMALDEIREPQQ